MVYLLVGCGGVIGALLRYGVAAATVHWWSGGFPIATLFVNCLGCFLLPFLTGKLTSRITVSMQKAITTGIIGSFTTFSTFSVETITLLEQGKIEPAIWYMLLSVGGGLFFVNLGYKGMKEI